MWGRGFDDFDNDPFFEPHRASFQNMFPRRGDHAALENSSGRSREDRIARRDDDFFRDPFGSMNKMMQEMSRNFGGGFSMSNMSDFGNDGSSHGYSYSSVMSYSNADGGGEPKFFEATSSTRSGPGGVKETRKTVRDSESGLAKMAVGHHINDRGHVIERSLNKKTNKRDERQNFINMEESEAERFNEEWTRATRNFRDSELRGIDEGKKRRRDMRSIKN